MLENTWSVSIRHTWELPHNSQRYFNEPLGGVHVSNMLQSRYVSFIKSAQKSSKLSALLMLQMVKDDMQMQTVTGRNIRHILTDVELDDMLNVKKSDVLKKVHCHIKPADEWKLNLVKEITNVRKNVLKLEEDENGQFTNDKLCNILDYITSNLFHSLLTLREHVVLLELQNIHIEENNSIMT